VTTGSVTPSIVAVVALGSAVGASARWLCGELAPDGGGFAWTTLAVNVTGSLLLGLLLHRTPPDHVHRVVFLGPGVLGGFTTLSAYAEQIRDLLADGRVLLGLSYAVASLLSCVAAVALARNLPTTASGPTVHAP